MQFNKKLLKKMILAEMAGIGNEDERGETVFKKRELTHEITKTLNELSFYIEKADEMQDSTDMDTIELPKKALKNWRDVLEKFLMAIGG